MNDVQILHLICCRWRTRVRGRFKSKLAPQWRQFDGTMAIMPSVQIKSVPEDVHAELRRRAEKAGKSLQEYLLGWLVEEARRPAVDDLLDRAGRHKGGRVSFRFASEAVREDRDAS